MFFAVIGDIKSNFSGLSAIIRILEEEGIHTILHTGNVCGGPENALHCLSLLRQCAILSVQGAADKKLARQGRRLSKGDDASRPMAQTFAALDSNAIEYLNRLPRKRTLIAEGISIVLCHGSLNCASAILNADDAIEKFRRQRELDPSPIIVLGGAKEPFVKQVDDALFVCPGEMTVDASTVRYLLVDTETVPFRAALHTIPCA